MKLHKTVLSSAVAAAVVLFAAAPAFAADALFICQSGVPFAYPGGGADIPFNPDQGGLGPLGNAAAVAAVSDAFDAWAAVPTATATFSNEGLMPFDVTLANFMPIFNPPAPDGLSPIVFDEDGSIFTFLFGAGSGILGFAGPDFGNNLTCELIEGSAFLNGPEFDDLIVAEDIMVHEFGHYINLGHVELNGQLVAFFEGGDDSGPSPNNTTFGTPVFAGTEVIETMYPFYFGPDAGTRTLHADDVASVSILYPDPSFATTTGTITGTIFLPNGTTRLSGVNVIARNLADPFVDSVSTFSGAYTDSTSQADPNVGIYTLANLTPGAQYAVFVDQVTANPGRFSNPIATTLPGPEEFWNTAEANSNPPDDPQVFTAIAAAAGSTASGTDVIFNQPGPGDALPVGEDGFVQLALPFTFNFCGEGYDAIFVNANGNLTFGSGDTDFTESSAEFLNDQPRIAPLWDDLSPFNLFTGAQQGLVTFEQSKNTFTVIFENVPEFPDVGSNSFEVRLKRSADHIDINYGGLTAAGGLAGVSCGGAITSRFEEPIDLGAHPGRINLHNKPAVYEVFTTNNDLANDTVRFNGTTNYEDNWAEPNDSLAQARHVNLPFDSIPIQRYTEIEPAGDDVDYFEFEASAGDILIAETLTGQIDSVIGLFDSAGNLLAFDDDGGTGFLSRLVAVLPADDTYAVAVSTFDDFDFDGDGNTDPIFGQGRYVLSIETSDVLPLALGDDTSAEVPLGFTFPFQGGNFTSVFVNSNGNLTFGSGDTDFTETVGEFLSDQPRIAPLWDDLSPNNAGSVFASFAGGSMTVTFDGVPEFTTTGSNTFSVTLEADGTVTIDYGSVTALDAIVGVTQGGGAANPGETNFSAGGPFSVNGTTYEQFTGGGDPFDLGNQTVVFDP